jgi:hypothetical protein
MVGLIVFKVKDKETYNHLHTVLTGWVFFRNDGNYFYLKAPLNKTIKNLIEIINFLKEKKDGNRSTCCHY